MSVACTLEASLVVFSAFPIVVKVTEPFMDFEVVKGDISDDLFLEGSTVSVVINTVFEAQSIELSSSVQAVFHGLRDLVSESLDLVLEFKEVCDSSFSGLT